MGTRFPLLDLGQVEHALRKLGFEQRPGKRTSHRQWVKDTPQGRFKVTVDPPKSPFTHRLVGYMARQAGVSRKEFYRLALDKKK